MRTDTLDILAADALSAFSACNPLREVPAGRYAVMAYPRFPKLMHFSVRMFAVEGFGNVSLMQTRAMGLMRLMTLVFTPNMGKRVPLLLIDVMQMGRKNAAFVEYYDLTQGGCDAPCLQAAAETYRALPDYAEKPAWYVEERAPYSLIKGGDDKKALYAMLRDSVSAYAQTVAACTETGAENLTGLSAFIDRMVTDGNPSDATMTKVLGADGAKAFYTGVVMPKTHQPFGVKEGKES